MSIGYACLTVGVPGTAQRTCTSKHSDEETLLRIISHNLDALEAIIRYNIANDIKLFRISSDLIPFGSSPVNPLAWWELFADRLSEIGSLIRESGMRVSMHPGQYTVLNSPHEDVVARAVEDLRYHTRVLDSMGVGAAHKIVLHIGGVYGDKQQAVRRFIASYHRLEQGIKDRLVLENDDKSYTIEDVLQIATELHAPVIYDNLHNQVHCSDPGKSDADWIRACMQTWREKDGKQKVHYSQQDTGKRPGSHSPTIRIREFMQYYEALGQNDIDIMLEVKDKNLSAVKCINATRADKKIRLLEEEWSRYKYLVLDRAPAEYARIRKLLINKGQYPAVAFYEMIEAALQQENVPSSCVNAALHIWGFFKDTASDKQKKWFLKMLGSFEQGTTSLKTVKNILWKMAVEYEQAYLLQSYYFLEQQ